jgi:hypothetical protein
MTPAAGAARRASMPARASAAPDESMRGARDLHARLRSLQDRAAGIQADLDDLQRSTPYQYLFDGRELTGLTHSRLDATMGAVEALWQGYGVVSEMLAEAATVLNGAAWAREDALRTVEWMLVEDSLEVAGRRLTPDELLDELTHALSACAQIVEDADDVWRRTVPALVRCEDEIHALLQRAGDLVAAEPVETLRQLGAQGAHLREQSGVDPLGVVEVFERDLLPRLEQVRLRLTDDLRQHRAVNGDLARARARLTELRDLHARVVEEAGSVWSKIAHPRGLMAPPDPGYLTEPPMGLEPWLARLQALGRRGSYRQVRRGLASWMQAADDAMSREREVLEANRAPLGRRQELRGLLSSLEAKARAVGVARDAELADMAGRAGAILYAPQTDLDEATLLVKGYGDRLRALPSTNHNNRKEVSYR